MGLILLPFLLVAFGLTSVLLIKMLELFKQEKNYKILFYGLLISCIELSLLFLSWKLQHRIYAITPSVQFLSFLIIIPSIIALLLSLGKGHTQIAFMALGSSVLISIFLLLFHTFISSHFIHIFGILDVRTYH